MAEPLRVALIGLGDIAAKAYLPVLAASPGVEPVLVTRNAVTRARLQQSWRIEQAFPMLEDAMSAGVALDAGFVHAATVAHPGIARVLIDNGIPTFVDKPLALSGAESRELVLRARAAGVSLAACFNRRYAPAYREVSQWRELDTVVLTKNRIALPDEHRVVVFDDFVHVVDTLRFLVAPEPEDVAVSARATHDGRLGRVAITLRQGRRLGVGIMDRDSGQTVEILEAMAPRRWHRVTDLVHVVDRSAGAATTKQPDNWASVSQQRGFVGMIGELLRSVREGRVLDAGDALATHELCERILSEVHRQVG